MKLLFADVVKNLVWESPASPELYKYICICMPFPDLEHQTLPKLLVTQRSTSLDFSVKTPVKMTLPNIHLVLDEQSLNSSRRKLVHLDYLR